MKVPRFMATAGLIMFAAELLAQTATDPNEGARLDPAATPGAYALSGWGIAGRTYFVQHSEDLIHWFYTPYLDLGSDDILQMGCSSSAETFFLRLRFSDEPTGDPENADFDDDDMPNKWEVDFGLDPLNPDADGDPDLDGATNAEEYAADTAPNDPAPVLTVLGPTGAFLN